MSLPNLQLREAILTRIKESGENGRTLRELEDDLEANYYTLRNYVLNLEREGLIEKSSKPRNGNVYLVPLNEITPSFKTLQGEPGPMFYYLWNATGLPSKVDETLRPVILHMYHRAAQGGKGAFADPKIMAEDRRQLFLNIKRLESMLEFHKKLAHNSSLWDERVVDLTTDPNLGENMTPDKIYSKVNSILFPPTSTQKEQ